MKTIFEFLNNITYDKEKIELRDGDDFSPYMIQRWLSMVSPEVAFILNETFNTYHKGLPDKQAWNDALIAIIPRMNKGRIKYLKKDKKNHSEDVKDLARRLEISQREAKQMVEISSDINKKEKTVEVYKR